MAKKKATDKKTARKKATKATPKRIPNKRRGRPVGRVIGEDGLTDLQRNFQEAFVLRGSIEAAARQTGISRQTHYKWLKQDDEGEYKFPQYVEAWEDAKTRAVELLESELRRLGLVGEIKHAGFFQGLPVMDYIRDSDGEPILFDVINPETKKREKKKKLRPIMQATKSVAALIYLHKVHSPSYKGEKVEVTGTDGSQLVPFSFIRQVLAETEGEEEAI
jgi:hypothetical protein